jgi:hypothetical protein
MKVFHLTSALLAVVVLTLTACSDELTDELTGKNAGQPSAPAFQWTRAADVATHSTFIRNFGVGYSYNAVKGEFCNWKDIRCQVVDRNYCNFLENTYGSKFKYYRYEPTTGVNHFSKFDWSQRDYVTYSKMSFREEVDLGFYSGTRRQVQYVVENGVEESFYYQLREERVLYDLQLDYNELLHVFQRDSIPQLLTASFRDAVDHLVYSDPTDIAVVDSFINVWGTHVVVEAFLGGKLDVELSNYVWRYKDTGYNYELTAKEFLDMCEQKEEERKQEGFTWIEHGKLNISARGGDQSTLTGLLGEYQYDGKATFSTAGIEQWRNSITYDPNNELASNIEMVDMRAVPIWWFIAYIDENVAERVQAAVEQDVELQRKLLGEKNFFNTSFPIRYDTLGCEVQTQTGEWTTYKRVNNDADNPIVVNIESGQRIVATVCREKISTDWYWVAYPVYEGVVNQACGVAVDDRKQVYDVSWVNGVSSVTPRYKSGRPVTTDATHFYVSLGRIELEPDSTLTYEPSHPMPYYALSGGIQYDGTYRTTALPVTKQRANYIIHNADSTLTDIVGFSYDEKLKAYRRQDKYTYIYNPNEMRYEE